MRLVRVRMWMWLRSVRLLMRSMGLIVVWLMVWLVVVWLMIMGLVIVWLMIVGLVVVRLMIMGLVVVWLMIMGLVIVAMIVEIVSITKAQIQAPGAYSKADSVAATTVVPVVSAVSVVSRPINWLRIIHRLRIIDWLRSIIGLAVLAGRNGPPIGKSILQSSDIGLLIGAHQPVAAFHSAIHTVQSSISIYNSAVAVSANSRHASGIVHLDRRDNSTVLV